MYLRLFLIAALTAIPILGACASDDDEVDLGADECCAIPSTPAGCMVLGGPKSNGCGQTCDFACGTKFSQTKDAHGCGVWTYDVDPTIECANRNPPVVTDAGVSGAKAPTADASQPPGCCEISPVFEGCMKMGGSPDGGPFGCETDCDFVCGATFRTEVDQNGCTQWRVQINACNH